MYAWINSSVKMIASGDLFPDAIQSRIAVGQHATSTRPCAAPSRPGSAAGSIRAGPVGLRDRSALRRPVYGPYIGRASTARLITLSRMIYSVAGPQPGARGVAIVAADVRRPIAVAVTCRHLSRRPGAAAPSMPTADGRVDADDGRAASPTCKS